MREATAVLLPVLEDLDTRGVIVFALCLLFLLTVAAVSTLKRGRLLRLSAQWFSAMRGRNWPAIPASVELVTVVPQTEPIRGYAVEVVGYLATLTYFYRNPELQSGDYSRMFDKENEARAWAASWKNKTVMVRVHPREPSHSVWRQQNS